mgnify:CR=1 FL=1
MPTLIYALGAVGYDFGSEARRDSFVQKGLVDPSNVNSLLNFLEAHPSHAEAITWTLNQDLTPIYAILPSGPFASEVYGKLRQFMCDQTTPDGVELVSIPGWGSGKATLMSGQIVAGIVPDVRGMSEWSVAKLLEVLIGAPPTKGEALKAYTALKDGISNFLQRVYYEFRNLGVTPQERAINFAGTNAAQARNVFTDAIKRGLVLDKISLEQSSVCRPGSDCWDVKLMFFNPSKTSEQAKHVYRFTIDVSDVVPVTVGRTRDWDVYADN